MQPEAAAAVRELVERGRHREAAERLEAALAAAPADAWGWFALGVTRLELGEREAAAQAFRESLRHDPDGLDARLNLGATLSDLGRPAEALPELERALERAPEHVELLCNTALACVETGAPRRAVELLGRAARLRPGDAHLEGLRGLAELSLRRADAAAAHYREALRLAPRFAGHVIGLSYALVEAERADEAIRACEAFLEGVADDPAVHFELAQLLFGEGRIAEAMPHYGWRPPRRGRALPALESLRGQRILLEAEQGIGDELFFLRYLPGFRDAVAPAELAYMASPKFAPLAQRITGIDTHWSHAPQSWPGLRLPVGDLPVLLGASFAPTLELAPKPGFVAAARAELESRGRAPFLGVAWEGGTQARNRAERGRVGRVLHKRIPPEQLGAALRGWPGTVVALQRNPRRGEFELLGEALGATPLDLSSAHRDLEALHALLAALDDYVGVSTTSMHLLAAAGRRGRALVGHPADWRWMHRGERSRWFPEFPIYREARGGGWDAALARLRADLGLGG